MRPALIRILALLVPGLCLADGGALLLREQAGDRTFSVFTSPAELTAGPVEITVLVEGAGGQPLVGEPVEVAVTDEAGTVVSKAAEWGGAGNSALAAAPVMVPHAGEWTLRVRDGGREVSRRVKAGEARGRFLSHWRAWLFVPVLLGLFLWHQWLVRGGKQVLGLDRRTRLRQFG